MRKQFVIAILVGLSVAMVRPAFAQRVTSKDDVANEALNAAGKLDAQTAGMAANVAAATKQVPTWQKEAAAIAKLRDDGKADAQAANKAAQAALAAAKKCDKKEYEKQKAEAEKAAAKSKKETDAADKREATLTGPKQMGALSSQMQAAETAADQAQSDGKAFKMDSTNSSALGKLQIALDKYNNALGDTPGVGGAPSTENTPGLRSLQTQTKLVGNTLAQSHRDNDADTASERKAADQALKDAAAALKDCPPKEGAMAPKPTNEIYVALDTNCGTNVDLCNIKEGQDSRPVADSLGMQDCGAIATTTTDAVYHCPGSASRADTIKTRAKAKDICVGFSETNYCEGGAPFNSERSKFVNPVPIVIQLRRAVR
jgi:hypothetical protein